VDRLRDRLHALTEEVGEFAKPPGVAVALRRARHRRQRAVAVVVLSLLTPVIVVLSVSSPLERLGPAVKPGQEGGLRSEATLEAPSTTGSGPYRGPLFGSVSPSKVVRGQSFTVRVWGCPSNFTAEISVDFGRGLPDVAMTTAPTSDPGGSFSDRVEVHPEVNPGTYDVMLSCYASKHGAEEVRRQLRVTVLPN
jgi:hypothetical protein